MMDIKVPRKIRTMAAAAGIGAATLLGSAAPSPAQEVPDTTSEKTEQVVEEDLEDKVDLALGASVKNGLAVRGVELVGSPVFQAYGTASSGDVTGMVLNVHDVGESDLLGTHLIGNYTAELSDDATLDFTGTLYNFHMDDGLKHSYELAASLTLDDLLRVTAGHDFKMGDGSYIDATVSQDLEIDGRTINAEAELGYNHEWFTDFEGAYAEITLSTTLGDESSVTPTVKYLLPLDDEFRAGLYAGMTADVEF